jgi:multiple sugar transport system substrate-binding protein
MDELMSNTDKTSRRGSRTSVFTRRNALKTGFATALTASLTGCSGGSGNDGSGGSDGGSGDSEGGSDGSDGESGGTTGGGGTTEVVLWHGEAEQRPKRAVDMAVESFEEAHDGIAVDVQVVNERQISNQVLAGSQTGTLPNIIEAGSAFMGQVSSENLLDTDAAGEAIDRVGRDRFLDGPLPWGQSGGDFMMVPYYAFVNSFWWRKSTFEENGLQAPNSWDGLLEAAETLHNPDNNQFGIAFGTEKHEFTRQCWEAFALSNGARVLDSDGNVTFDTPEVVEALDVYAELAQYNPPGKHNFGVPRDLYVNESVHNSFWSSFLMTPIFDGGGESMSKDTGTIKLLENSTSAINGSVIGLGILNTDNRGIDQDQVEASIELAQWMLQPEAYIPLLHTRAGGYRPVVSGIIDNDLYTQETEANPDGVKVIRAWRDTMQQMSETLNSDKFTRHGLVEGKQFPSFGNVVGQNIIPEAIVKVIEGADAQEVATEYQGKIESSMQS